MTTKTSKPTIILIPGHWLGAWAWDEVRAHLTADDWTSIAMTLPGLDARDPQRASRTLEEQVAAIEQVMADAARVVIVAHSGANFPVSLVLDRHPARIHRMVWVDSGPVASGSVFAPDLPADQSELPLPPFDVLGAQASLEGLGTAALERFRERSVPVPGPVLRQPAELGDEARRAIPTMLVCCSIPGAQVMELAHAGHPMFAEVASLERLDLVDLPTGHWPMWSRPGDLAAVIAAAATAA